MTPWPWTASDFSSDIKSHGYPIKHCGEYVGWMVGHNDAQIVSRLPGVIKMAQRLLYTIDHLSPEQQALLEPHYIDALRETIEFMCLGQDK